MSAFNWVDYALVILIAGTGISGYMKGFIKSTRSVVAVWGGFLTARYMCVIFGDRLDALFGLRRQTSVFFNNWLTVALERSPLSVDMDVEHTMDILKIPDVLKAYLIAPVKQVTDMAGASLEQFKANLVEAISGKLTDMVALGILLLGLWIVIGIFYYFIISLLIPKRKKSIIKRLDKILGLVAGLFLEIALLTVVAGILYPIASAPEWAMGTPGFLAVGVNDSGLIPIFVRLYQEVLLTWVLPALGEIYHM